MSTVQRLRRIVDRLRAAGYTVIPIDGWETRGVGTIRPGGHLEHHTAGPRSGDAPSLRVVTFGRPGLRNSLSMWFVSRSGIIYLVAARVSWHAGAGSKGSNTTLSGTESENTGVGEPWGDRSLRSQAAIAAEMAREFEFGAARVWDHKEHAPRRKIDRTGIDPAGWRARVAAVMAGSPVMSDEEDLMITPGTKGPYVEHVQRLTNGILHRSTALGDYPPVDMLTIDGDYGPKSQVAVAHALGRAAHYIGIDLASQPDKVITPAEVFVLGQTVRELGQRLAQV